MSKVLVIDNGSYNIKIGHAIEKGSLPDGFVNTATPFLIPNCITHGKNKRSYVGSQFSSCSDFSGLTFQRPHEKGQLVDWRLEYAIWNYTFYGQDSPISVDPSETSLILTEAPMSLPATSANTDQMIFEEYGFESYYRCTPGSLVPWNNFEHDFFTHQKKNTNANTSENSTPTRSIDKQHPLVECALVVDVGFNSTTIMPTILGEVYWPGVQQINVGGRLLTNYFRETLSFRHYNMMEDTYLVNAIKEATCFVSTDFSKDLKICEDYRRKKQDFLRGGDDEDEGDSDYVKRLKKRKEEFEDNQPFLAKYALPDNPSEIGRVIGSISSSPLTTSEPAVPKRQSDESKKLADDSEKNSLTHIQSEDQNASGLDTSLSNHQILRLTTERFTIPEVLFSPHYVGLTQCGLTEAIMASVTRSPPELHTLLLANIVLVGGSANLPGLKERLKRELEACVPSYSSLSLKDFNINNKNADQGKSSSEMSGNGNTDSESGKYRGSGAVSGLETLLNPDTPASQNPTGTNTSTNPNSNLASVPIYSANKYNTYRSSFVATNSQKPMYLERLFSSSSPTSTLHSSLRLSNLASIGLPSLYSSPTSTSKSLLRIFTPASSPETYAWQGGTMLGLQPEMLAKVHVTRDDYLEHGERICAQKFNPKLGSENSNGGILGGASMNSLGSSNDRMGVVPGTGNNNDETSRGYKRKSRSVSYDDDDDDDDDDL